MTWLWNWRMQVVDVTGKRKDAAYLVALHEQAVTDLHSTHAKKAGAGDGAEAAEDSAFIDRFLGTVMDNTSTNMAASAQLEQKHPSWLALGCVVHALNLLFKDMAKQSKTDGDDDAGQRKRQRTEPAKVR
jgi:hypothetical protein